MKVEFVKLSPTQNMTILVKTPVERENHLEVATKLMDYASVGAEQVGFIENGQGTIRLQMMAGEFCGNASMSMAAYLASKRDMEIGEEMHLLFEVSGAEKILDCSIKAVKDGYVGKVNMPLPLKTEDIEYVLGDKKLKLTTVFLPGIRHIILPSGIIGEDFRKILENNIDAFGKQFDDEAFGLIVFDEDTLRIDPLVVVKGASCVWERGCGSGSEAVAVFIAEREKKSVLLSISQPGGVIKAEAVYDNGIKSVSISGLVKIVAEGVAYI